MTRYQLEVEENGLVIHTSPSLRATRVWVLWQYAIGWAEDKGFSTVELVHAAHHQPTFIGSVETKDGHKYSVVKKEIAQ
jgi:hypothetical protein